VENTLAYYKNIGITPKGCITLVPALLLERSKYLEGYPLPSQYYIFLKEEKID
jgi:hypothetical protein